MFCKLQKNTNVSVHKNEYNWDSIGHVIPIFVFNFEVKLWNIINNGFYHDNLNRCVGGLHENLLLLS
jgi:hypothetical protein